MRKITQIKNSKFLYNVILILLRKYGQILLEQYVGMLSSEVNLNKLKNELDVFNLKINKLFFKNYRDFVTLPIHPFYDGRVNVNVMSYSDFIKELNV